MSRRFKPLLRAASSSAWMSWRTALLRLRQRGDVRLHASYQPLPLLQNPPNGPEQHHVQEKDQEEEIGNLHKQRPINVNHLLATSYNDL
jgi:hypothetical protein